MLYSLISCICLLASAVLLLTVRMPSGSMSGIPCNAGPLPDTTKSLDNLSLFLYFMVMLHTPK